MLHPEEMLAKASRCEEMSERPAIRLCGSFFAKPHSISVRWRRNLACWSVKRCTGSFVIGGRTLSERPLVLVVEDEYLLQCDLQAELAKGGFASEGVFSGEEALTLFTGGARNYKALVTDVRLGGNMSGWEVAKRLREKEPTLPVVYVTASAAEEWASHGVSGSIFVPKPFATAQLLTALSTLLNIGPTP